MQIQQFFLNGDMNGAIAYMRAHEEFKDILPAYAAIFEDEQYRMYEIPDALNAILRLYQVYFRDVFYCGLPETEAAERLRTRLQELLAMPEADGSRPGDSHAAASARIRREFAGTDPADLSGIQTRALALLRAHTKEMEEKYVK